MAFGTLLNHFYIWFLPTASNGLSPTPQVKKPPLRGRTVQKEHRNQANITGLFSTHICTRALNSFLSLAHCWSYPSPSLCRPWPTSQQPRLCLLLTFAQWIKCINICWQRCNINSSWLLVAALITSKDSEGKRKRSMERRSCDAWLRPVGPTIKQAQRNRSSSN